MIIGVFGGTFDPVHNGHMVAAREVVDQLALDKLYMVVAGMPWQKVDHSEITRAEDRFAMVRVALNDPEWATSLHGVEASRMEIDRSGVQTKGNSGNRTSGNSGNRTEENSGIGTGSKSSGVTRV